MAASEEVGTRIVSHAKVASERLRGITEKVCLVGVAVLHAADEDAEALQVHVVEREEGRFFNAQAVVIDEGEERPIPRGFDGAEEACGGVLGEVLRKLVLHDH